MVGCMLRVWLSLVGNAFNLRNTLRFSHCPSFLSVVPFLSTVFSFFRHAKKTASIRKRICSVAITRVKSLLLQFLFVSRLQTFCTSLFLKDRGAAGPAEDSGMDEEEERRPQDSQLMMIHSCHEPLQSREKLYP
mmetsp:Transcript_26976/g.50522  ORF Transcript_26976/g.50522 Transcript_26976/m.50522 type:complete len:134 (+) Transcript_26976:1280-1681(+)